MRQVVDIARNNNDIRFMENYYKYKEKVRDWKPIVKWYHGSTGSGKTRSALKEAGEDCWVSMGTGQWFEGYDAHENVVFDDIRENFVQFKIWLNILDRYPCRVPIKGSSRQFLAKNIWITSPYSPTELWSGRCSEDIQQFIRRLDVIKLFGTEVAGNTKADF